LEKKLNKFKKVPKVLLLFRKTLGLLHQASEQLCCVCGLKFKESFRFGSVCLPNRRFHYFSRTSRTVTSRKKKKKKRKNEKKLRVRFSFFFFPINQSFHFVKI